MKQSFKILSMGCLILVLSGLQNLFAQTTHADEKEQQEGKKQANAEDEVSTKLISANKNAIFDSRAQFTFVVKNASGTEQVGKVSYLVTTETGQKLHSDSVKVRIARKSSGRYTFEIPETKPGFYKVNFMVNVTDYDDTTRRVFGIRPEEIKSAYSRPPDFDEFWNSARSELDKIAPEFKMTPLPDSNKENRKVFLFEMKSLDNLTIRGYVTIPAGRSKHHKFAVLLACPPYQIPLPPLFGSDEDIAIVSLNVRGQGNSRDVIHTRHDDYIFYHIEDRDQYVMRGAVMDCLRAVDFIFSRPEFDHTRIMASGGSMGGFLALATAALDKRVALCSVQNPILSDIHNLTKEVEWPMNRFTRYTLILPGITTNQILNNLDYFDSKNFALRITCPT